MYDSQTPRKMFLISPLQNVIQSVIPHLSVLTRMKTKKVSDRHSPDTQPIKKMSRVVSFQPADDVRHILEGAKAAGIDITAIINGALRTHGASVAQDLANEVSRKLDQYRKKLN
jgi:hypothetical protein